MQLPLFRLLDTTSTWESSISLIRNSKPSARMHARLGWHRSVYSIKLPTNNIWTSYQHETSCNKIDLKRNCLLRTKTYWRYRNNIQQVNRAPKTSYYVTSPQKQALPRASNQGSGHHRKIDKRQEQALPRKTNPKQASPRILGLTHGIDVSRRKS